VVAVVVVTAAVAVATVVVTATRISPAAVSRPGDLETTRFAA